ncbi:MAG: amidohydrolase family protein [Methanosarcinales archaeon]
MSDLVEPSSIPVDAYFEYALSLTSKEQKLIREFSKWLPNEIIDAHAHSNTKRQWKLIDDYYLSHLPGTFPWFEVSKHMKVNRILYPAIKVKMLLSPFTYRGTDHRTANNYIVRQATQNPQIIPVACGISNDIDYTITILETRNFHGLKMYSEYFPPSTHKISQYFPNRVLRYCNEENFPIILHLPQPVIRRREELVSITKKFPDLKIILAHMGLAYLPIESLKKTFSLLSRYKKINLDTAMVTSAEVFKAAFEILGYHRIIYGTDQPLNLVRGRMYHNPTLGIRVATEYPYHWVDLKEQRKFSRYAKDAVLLHWEILLALQKAIQMYGESKNIKNCIFRKNAKRVFGLS